MKDYLEDYNNTEEPLEINDNSNVCTWIQYEAGFYDTDCRGVFFFVLDSNIEETYFRFCPFCGKRITIIDKR